MNDHMRVTRRLLDHHWLRRLADGHDQCGSVCIISVLYNGLSPKGLILTWKRFRGTSSPSSSGMAEVPFRSSQPFAVTVPHRCSNFGALCLHLCSSIGSARNSGGRQDALVAGRD